MSDKPSILLFYIPKSEQANQRDAVREFVVKKYAVESPKDLPYLEEDSLEKLERYQYNTGIVVCFGYPLSSRDKSLARLFANSHKRPKLVSVTFGELPWDMDIKIGRALDKTFHKTIKDAERDELGAPYGDSVRGLIETHLREFGDDREAIDLFFHEKFPEAVRDHHLREFADAFRTREDASQTDE